ncbi:MAG: NAD-dependent protein deacylase [Actinomycetota bacterium]|nr:NAD-dependent protein deacylase [Actinomycetota bacterium]
MNAPTAAGERLPEEVADLVRRATSVVALTGAGISTDSGIPDFRGPQGLWTKDPKAERLSSLQAYMEDPELRVRAWRLRLEHPAWTASPNAGHRALAVLERKGRLDTLVTQNIDGLHQAAGTSPGRIVEVHGTLREVMCMSCDDRAPMEAALERVRAGEPDPPCRTCGGILKSATISFGQPLRAGDMERARAAAESCDVFLAIGTSLTVYPVAYLPAVAARAGAAVVILNAEPTPYDRHAHAVVRLPLGETLPEMASRV